MARGRQQKWICLDCGAAFAVQGIAPKMWLRLRVCKTWTGTEP